MEYRQIAIGERKNADLTDYLRKKTADFHKKLR